MNTAGGWRRFFADCIDNLILGIGSFLLGVLMGLFFPPPILDLLGNLISGTLLILYFSLLESSSAQSTLGQRFLGIRVFSLSYERISFWRALYRVLITHFAIIVFGVVGLFFSVILARLQIPALAFGVYFFVLLPFCVYAVLAFFYLRLFSGKKQTLRDYLTSTLMIKTATVPVKNEEGSE